MRISAEQLRDKLEEFIDKVIESGESIELVYKGKIIALVSTKAKCREVTIVKTDEDMNIAHKHTGNFIGIFDGKIGNRDEKGHLARIGKSTTKQSILPGASPIRYRTLNTP